jgi:hypothetical protein
MLMEGITVRIGPPGITMGAVTMVMAPSVIATTAAGITVVDITATGAIELDKSKDEPGEVVCMRFVPGSSGLC